TAELRSARGLGADQAAPGLRRRLPAGTPTAGTLPEPCPNRDVVLTSSGPARQRFADARGRAGVTKITAMRKDGPMGELIVIRHGETVWSRELKHTGRTDIPLTPAGEKAAAALAEDLAARPISAVFASPAQRAIRTAELAGLTITATDPDLWEWD